MDGSKASEKSWFARVVQRWSRWWRGNRLDPPLRALNLTPPCSECGNPTGLVRLFEYPNGWRLGLWGVADVGGGGADPVSDERARAICEALTPPYAAAKIQAAGFYDDFGYCMDCGKFYCSTHWQVSSTGLGTCPAGHFKSLDPHWHPDWDDL